MNSEDIWIECYYITGCIRILIEIDIISAIQNYSYILILYYTSIIYQCCNYLDHEYWPSMIIDWGQNHLNVASMRHKNSVTYMQRRINGQLGLYRKFNYIYIDNIVIFSYQSLKYYLTHLHAILFLPKLNNISIKSIKASLA